jgi:hypothetical protein
MANDADNSRRSGSSRWNMTFRKLRIAWLIACVGVGVSLVYVREVTYPRFEKFVLPSVVILITSFVLASLAGRSR